MTFCHFRHIVTVTWLARAEDRTPVTPQSWFDFDRCPTDVCILCVGFIPFPQEALLLTSVSLCVLYHLCFTDLDDRKVYY